MTARNNSRMHLPFFCKSLSECEYTFGITITVLKISQNNDNRGRHLEFYSHTGIGNWFQCFPVYPGLNLSSGSGSGSGSGSEFRIPAFPYAQAFRGVCFLIIQGKTNKSNLVLLVVLHPIISLNFPQNNLNHETTH